MKALYLTAGLFVSSLVMAQVAPQARLSVTCTPVAQLQLNHVDQGANEHFSLTVPAGVTQLLTVSAPGYVTQYRSVTVEAGDRRSEEFRLVLDKQPVLLRSVPAASVLCDGAEIGKTPCTSFFDNGKTYRVVFRSPGYKDGVLSLDMKGCKPRVVDMELTSESGTLEVTSEPAGATVLIHGVDKGKTPCTLQRINTGEMTLAFVLDGYLKETKTVLVEPGQTQQINLALKPEPAGLRWEVEPASATLYVNGKACGKGEAMVQDLQPGDYQLRAVAPGYEPMEKTISFVNGAHTKEVWTLKQLFGKVSIATHPGKVKVVLNGKTLLVTTPTKQSDYTSETQELTLPVGVHKLNFMADGYHTTTREVKILNNDTAKLAITLTFAPNFEVKTKYVTYQGYLIKRESNGNVRMEIKPGQIRTFVAEEILETRLIK